MNTYKIIKLDKGKEIHLQEDLTKSRWAYTMPDWENAVTDGGNINLPPDTSQEEGRRRILELLVEDLGARIVHRL